MPSSPTNSRSPLLRPRLEALRGELADLAFALEQRGRFDAADVANTVAARLRELCDASATRPTPPRGAGPARRPPRPPTPRRP